MAIVRRGLEALLDTDTWPWAFPSPDALKFTEIVTDLSGVRVAFDPPLTVKPLPLTNTEEILTFERPVFFSDTSWAVDVPTITLPNDTLDELGVSTPWVSLLAGVPGCSWSSLWALPPSEPAHPAILRSAAIIMATRNGSKRDEKRTLERAWAPCEILLFNFDVIM
jgi:hypothetical protein